MVAGLLLGRFVPALSGLLARLEVGGISVPIALGLLVMMYPVLAKVRYDKVAAVTGDKKLLVSSLLLNWLVGPAVMFALAWIFLPGLLNTARASSSWACTLYRDGGDMERSRLR